MKSKFLSRLPSLLHAVRAFDREELPAAVLRIMATALTAQLAKIRGQNANPLDLKAQRKAHSQSILFNPSHARDQDFETIYQICLEGFEELCQLDSRFGQFAGSIFSEQSKAQDRSQLTKLQNQQLNRVLEEFLYLVGGRLALKPAIKAVEWLVRRFRYLALFVAIKEGAVTDLIQGFMNITPRSSSLPSFLTTLRTSLRSFSP